MAEKSTKIIIGTVAAIAVGAAAAGYIYYAQQYKQIFLPGTTVNGIDVAGLTVSDVEDRLAQNYEGYTLTVAFREDQKEVIDGKDIDYQYHKDTGVQTALEMQNPYLWLPAMLGAATDYLVPTSSQYSEEKLENAIRSLPELDPENMEPAVRSYLTFRDDSYVIIPEEEGTTLDPEIAADAIINAIGSDEKTLDITAVPDLYTEPRVRSTDEMLQENCEQLNDLAVASITFTMPSGDTRVLNGNTLRDWLVRDEEGNYYKDDEIWNQHLQEYVDNLAAEVTTLGKERPFKNHSGDIIMVPPSDYYGWKLDTEAELAQLKEELANNAIVERELNYSKKEVTTLDDNYGYGSFYVDIDLGEQHLWVFKDGEILFDTDVVSGRNTDERRTPAGSFFIYDKQRNKVLKGNRQPNGKYGYQTKVKYWMRLTNDGVGLHDASWRGRFGGSIWRRSGSHGCINLPPKAAATLYDMLPEHTPVIVYYTED